MRTSIRKRGGSDCSRRTRTPRPITVARLQWVIVGVMRTVTVWRGESGTFGSDGRIEISGSETTANSPSEIGCSGSWIVDIKSESAPPSERLKRRASGRNVRATYRKLLARRSAPPSTHRRFPTRTMTRGSSRRGRWSLGDFE